MSGQTAHWYAVITNPKCEAKAEDNLRAAGFETYMAWQRFERFNSRKKKRIIHEVRLFPRYLFLNVGPLARSETPWGVIRSCEGVEAVLGINGLPSPLSGEDRKAIERMRQAEANHEFDETREGKLFRREIGKTKRETTRMKFPVGSKVRINDGPFATFGGEVTNVNGRGHLLVMTELFGRLTPVELEADQVEGLASAA